MGHFGALLTPAAFFGVDRLFRGFKITEEGEMNGINIMALGVRDMARSVKFYRDLGFESGEITESPRVIFFNSGGTKSEPYPIQGMAGDINSVNPPEIGRGFGGITLAHTVKSEREVRDTIELARNAGATIAKEPQSVFWGGHHAYSADPDGYHREVAHAPDWKFDERDMLIPWGGMVPCD
jgi:catechol 2,3-dioxygenase-like lactoylglutathione lyase family enzyme